MNSSTIKMLNISGTTRDIAIDFHEIPYYGDKNTPGVRGIKLTFRRYVQILNIFPDIGFEYMWHIIVILYMHMHM